MFRTIVERDMYLRDQDVLKWLREKMNPETRRVRTSGPEIAAVLGCSEQTAWSILRRLAGSGHIIRHSFIGRAGQDIEVVCPPSNKAVNT